MESTEIHKTLRLDQNRFDPWATFSELSNGLKSSMLIGALFSRIIISSIVLNFCFSSFVAYQDYMN